jgi:hypothetical protein
MRDVADLLKQVEKADPKRAKELADKTFQRLSEGKRRQLQKMEGAPTPTPEQPAEPRHPRNGNDALSAREVLNSDARSTDDRNAEARNIDDRDRDFDIDFTGAPSPQGGTEKPDELDAAAKGALDFYNDELLAIRQGTSPIVRGLDGTDNYQRAPRTEQYLYAESGKISDSGKYVVLRDPDSRQLAVWHRNPEMSESGAGRAGRLLGLGVLGPLKAGASGVRAATAAKAAGHNIRYAASNRNFANWAGEILSGKAKAGNKLAKVGQLDNEVKAFLKSKGITPAKDSITVLDMHLTHMACNAKRAAGKSVPDEMLRHMPEILGNPKAVLWDKKKGNLLYAFDVPDGPKKGKFVVEVDFNIKVFSEGRRQEVVTNSVKTGGMVGRDHLIDTNSYDVIKGGL